MRRTSVWRLLDLMKRDHCTDCGNRMHDGYCETCGYPLIEQTREKVSHPQRL